MVSLNRKDIKDDTIWLTQKSMAEFLSFRRYDILFALLYTSKALPSN